MLNRFEAATGTVVPNDRAAFIAMELDREEYPEATAKAAERWIMHGMPCRLRTLVYADFFPNEEQMQSVNFDLRAVLAAEHERGRRIGYDQGRAYERDIIKDEWTGSGK